jgi:hypothetical protein
MPIPNPILDNRSYQQLRDELVRRIPVYAPEWTDHNASDPGITLIELFAFLGENLLFGFNQLPESAKLEFLRLLQIPLRPAQPAKALVITSTKTAAGVPVLKESQLAAGKVPFHTAGEVVVWPVSCLAVARASVPCPDPQTEPETNDFFIRALDAIGPLPAGQQAVCYQNQIVDLKSPPVDFEATVDKRLWIAVLGQDGVAAEKLGQAVLNLGFVFDSVFVKVQEVEACPGAVSTSKPPPVAWKISTSSLMPNGQPRYLDLTVAGDTTFGLTQNGVVRLQLPANSNQFGLFPVSDPDASGTGDFPPTVESDKPILFWVYAFRQDNSTLGKLLYAGANAVEVSQVSAAPLEFLGTGNSQPTQSFPLINKHVLAGTTQLEVDENGQWTRWTEVENFISSKADDRYFCIDSEAGKVSFGDGFRGYPPQIGQRIRVVSYSYGGGREGNVKAGAISQLVRMADNSPVGDIKVQNPLPAYGGADSEGIKDGLERVPGELRRRDRAVTATDFQELAVATPGADVGRAECLPRFYPPTGKTNAAGVVSVVVWPRQDAAHPNAPVPDQNLLSAVCRWLDQRRLITTELYVIPPTYRRVAVAVGLQAKPGYGIVAVRHWVELVIRQYLAPLPPFGPEGQGWPLGRRVYGPELEAAALQVEGVQFLNGLSVAGWEGTSWVPGTVELALYEVPELAEITVVEGPPLEPGQIIEPPVSVVAVPIPIIREEC